MTLPIIQFNISRLTAGDIIAYFINILYIYIIIKDLITI